MERAGDEVASWFGDEEAAQRREADHRGRGPQDYTRSDDRIREDANDRLTDDWKVDASGISVTVSQGEVTLNGTVPSRDAKRHAEDCVEDISGVKHVQNNLRVQQTATGAGMTGAGMSGTATSATTARRGEHVAQRPEHDRQGCDHQLIARFRDRFGGPADSRPPGRLRAARAASALKRTGSSAAESPEAGRIGWPTTDNPVQSL